MRTILLVISFTFLTSATFTQNDPDTIWAGIVSNEMVYSDNDIVDFCFTGWNVDLNGDGINDFKFVFNCWESMNTQGATVDIDMLGNTCWIAPLDSGAFITQNFCNFGQGELAYNYHYPNGPWVTGGPWYGVSQKYMALEINNTDIPFLAWIRMTIHLDMTWSYLTIYEYAYQDFTSGMITHTENIGFYPVPVKDVLTVSFKNNEEATYEVRIYNSMGNIFLKSKMDMANNQINMRNFIPGIYLIECIPSVGKSFTKRIIRAED